MKSAEARDAMVKRVQAVHKKYPHFGTLPETAAGDVSAEVSADASGYVKALYSVCYEGEVIGRNGNKVMGKYL